jgi:hypothetical protein
VNLSGGGDGDRGACAEPDPKGRFTAAFCARLLYLKFVLGLPVTRIATMLAAEGLAVSQGTLAGVLKALADLLVPVETAIVAGNAAATQAHADETTWRVYANVEDSAGHTWWLWVLCAADTIVFRMDPTCSNQVVDTHFGITAADREAGALPDGRQLVVSSDFYTVYQSLARLDGVDALWCWTHIRRYFIRAGDAHTYLRAWSDAWVARIADLHLAHKAMAAAAPGTGEHAQASTAFEAALTVIDTVRREQMAGPAPHPGGRQEELLRQAHRMVRPPGRPGLDRHRHRRTPQPRTPDLPDRLPHRLRPLRRQTPQRPSPRPVPALAPRPHRHASTASPKSFILSKGTPFVCGVPRCA